MERNENERVLMVQTLTGTVRRCLITTSLQADPTDGFKEVPLTNENFDMQKPFNEPLRDRYSDEDGIRRLWGLDYSSGIWQFEGYGYVPKGTSGVTIMQIHGAREGATSLQLRIYNGDMKYYKTDVIDRDLYDRWFRLNVIHNVDEGKISVFIDGVQKYEVNDQGPGDLYFKCGVYAAPAGSSNYMESRWKNIKIYRK
ncbi:citrate-binding protein-like [Lycium barbarum]|uniref:citrate-binding protein-like n=1 Tax=Lycium barbarum TaxID=112863 RepID=UPI00293F36E9|nr:citrate-binding protein-like [Lycium barbarum]